MGDRDGTTVMRGRAGVAILSRERIHAELMKLNGRYARLFRMQASAYTGEDVVPEPEDVKV